MKQMDSYFRLKIGETGISLQYFPPVDGGAPLEIEDVTSYLQKNNIKDFDLVLINETIKQNTPKTIRISSDKAYFIDEFMDVEVAPDNMVAVARFYPPSDNGSSMTFEEIMRDLGHKNIHFGIDEKIIEEHVNNPLYMTKIVIAKGLEPVQGHDARIEYKFNTDRKAKPQLNEDGTVDFHKLNNINHISTGDVLAIKYPEDIGISGKDVHGTEIKPAKVDRLNFRYGNNIKLSEDGNSLISLVDGHVTLDGDRVSVSNVYEVSADVDTSTGDIEYNGSVTVKGNVRTGFKIRAKGNVEISGVVEGALIIADGDVILHRGIQGMGRCQIIAKGNLVSRFIESAVIAVNGYIETDTILHSNVTAKGDIYVRGKNGNIIGGNVRSKSLIEATCIGSPMGTTTCVEVGTDPEILDQMNKLKKEIAEKTKEKTELTQNIMILKNRLERGRLEKEKMPLLKINATKAIQLDEEIGKLTEEYEKKCVLLDENKNAKINIVKTIYQGCKVTISGDYILIHESLARCSYKKEKSEIKAFPL